MNQTSAPFSRKTNQHSARQLSVITVALCIFLSTAAPLLADTLSVNQVVQTLSSSQGTLDLRVKNLVLQDPVTKGPTQQGGPRSEGATGPQGQGGPKTDSIVSGVIVTSEGQRLGVEVIEEGEVEGTVCDCGEILIAGGAFPKWPLLFLAAVPLVFIKDCHDCDETPSSSPTPTPPSAPTPTPTPPGVPEPASLLLFGTGLAAAGAGLRRRFARAKLVQQIADAEEE